MKETNFTSHPLSRLQLVTRMFLVFAICCLGITSAKADHLPVGPQPATPYIVPDNINQIDPDTNTPILFEDTHTAILEVVGMNCGSMSYPFFDAGGVGAPFSDEGSTADPDQAFTICLRNPMLQSFSVQFSNITFDPTQAPAEMLNIYDGDDVNDQLIAGSPFASGATPLVYPGVSGAGDGSYCLTFEIINLQGVSSSEGFRASVDLFEFAPSVVCLPFVEIDGFELGGADGLTPANPPVPVGIAGNGIVEIDDCNDTIPQQMVPVDWGCGIFDVPAGSGAANPAYSYDVKITQNGGVGVVYTGGPATADPEDITIPGAALGVGVNQVEVILNYTDANTGVTPKASCITDIVVNTTTPLVCNDDLNIGLDADCVVEIVADDLLEAPCTDPAASDYYFITAELVEVHENYCIDQNGDLVYNIDDVQLLLDPAAGHIGNNGTSQITVTIPGFYRYHIQLGDQSCWGFFNLEDKRGPVCEPFGDDEWNEAWDVDCDGVVETRVQANDPSGDDDLLDEYVLCKFIEINDGPELWFDILEPRDADLDGNGTTDVIGDFVDCSGVDYIYFIDEHIEICELTDLNGLPVDDTRYDVDQFEVCDVYVRTWFAIDKGGYQSAQGCSQYVFSMRPKAHKIELPLEVIFDCTEGEEQAGPTFTVGILDAMGNVVNGDGLENGGAGSDHTGQYNAVAPFTANAEFDTDLDTKVWLLEPNTHSCKYAVSFHADPQIDICATSYKKLYHWTVVDWCDGSRVYDEHTQLVKVEDTTGPVIELANGQPADGTTFTVNVSFFECTSDQDILALLTDDNCEPDVSQIDNVTIERIAIDPHDEDIFVHQFPNGGNLLNDLPNGTQTEFPEGDYTVTYFATDDCGNQSIATLTMQVRDGRAPVAICNDALNVTLTNFNDGLLLARVYPEDVDDSSFDNCQEIGMKVRSNNNAFTGDNNWGDFVELSCDDVAAGAEDVMVELLVFEDRNLDGEFVDNLTPNPAFTPGSGLPPFFNSSDGIDDVDGGLSTTCWAFVNVEDKDIPAIECTDKVLDCDDPNLEAYRSATPTEDGEYICPPTFTGGCPNADDITLTMFPFDITYDPSCKVGTFVRRWTARRTIDGVVRTATCDQFITVNYKSDWTMDFPLDEVFECAEEGTTLPAPLAIDDILTNDGCDQWGMEVSDETFDIIGVDGDGSCYKVVRTYKFINWCTWDPTNTELGIVNRPEGLLESNPVQLRHRSTNFGRNDFGDEEDGDPYDEIISALDITAAFGGPNPPATNTPDDDGAMVLIDNDFNVGDDPQGTIFLFQRQYNERINNNDNVTGVYANNYGYFAYRQTIKVADSQAPVIADIADIELCDTLALFPQCGADITICGPDVTECRPSYLTTYTVTDANGGLVASGDFPQGATPEDCVELGYQPFGTYTVNYLVEDGCGNFSDVTYTITSRDCKAPTAYCIFGLSVDLMPSGMVELWAEDFNAGSFDECSEPITFSFDEAGTQTGITYTCDNVGTNEVQLWVTDAVGNSAFCTTFVVVQPNPNSDGSSGNECVVGARISGAIATETGQDVEGVEVGLSGNMDGSMTTGVEGTFEFVNVDLGHDYTVTAEKDINYLNGVSTFDLVLFKKHIIGIELLDSPYKLIAADVNNSGTITTFDMVTLRKVILNIDTEFENNTSWRFVDAAYEFPTPSNPWAEVFPELVNINDIEADTEVNFVAIKIGDVNGSAIPNNLVSPDDRSDNATFTFKVADQAVKAGETYTVDFTADMAGIAGYQFTLNYNNLDLVEVVEGVATTENFGIFNEEGVITTSWEGEAAKDAVLFSLVFTAQTDANLSELMAISSRYTVAEAYQGAEVMNVSLDFGAGVVDAANALYQNTPNPFQGVTTVSFNLATDASATITVSDVTGKVIKLINGDFAKGMNTVQIDSKDLNATGVMYYTLETEDFTATRKMVIIK